METNYANCYGEIIVSRDEKHEGRLSGKSHPCTLEGCRGSRLSVKWDDGRKSFPCTAGLTKVSGIWYFL